jgi:exopolysaccharide biosynthesis protein
VRDTFTTRRAGICLTSTGDILVYCVSSALVSMTMPALQELLTSSTVGCTEALNLDGGGSAQLYARGAQTPGLSEADATRPPREVSVDGIDRVPVFLGFFDDNDAGAEQ